MPPAPGFAGHVVSTLKDAKNFRGTSGRMKLCFTQLYYDPAFSDPRGFLDRVLLLRELPMAMAAKGHDVDVVILWPSAHYFEQAGVRFHFVASGRAAAYIGRRAGRLTGLPASFLEPAVRAARLIRRLNPDVVHFHGAGLHVNLMVLHLALWDRRTPVVLHYHGGGPSRKAAARAIQRFNFRRSACCCFTTDSHADSYRQARLIPGAGFVRPLMETSSTFRPKPRATSSSATGMYGDPVYLSVARLHADKDPLTVLRGFRHIAEEQPEAQLYLYYQSREMLPELRAQCGDLERVHFRGPAPFEQMENIYNSADFLLQASRREYSGCAVLEAMACGVIPIVSDIHSFRRMTDDSRAGNLFPPGEDVALAQAALAVPKERRAELAADVRRRFEQALSFDAIAADLEALYSELLAH